MLELLIAFVCQGLARLGQIFGLRAGGAPVRRATSKAINPANEAIWRVALWAARRDPLRVVVLRGLPADGLVELAGNRDLVWADSYGLDRPPLGACLAPRRSGPARAACDDRRTLWPSR